VPEDATCHMAGGGGLGCDTVLRGVVLKLEGDEDCFWDCLNQSLPLAKARELDLL
jgi:hypothetical protein